MLVDLHGGTALLLHLGMTGQLTVHALAERLMTKPLGSRVRAMVSTLGVVRTGLDGAV